MALPSTGPDRGPRMAARHRRATRAWLLGLLVAVAAAALGGYAAGATERGPPPRSSVSSSTMRLPDACTQALALARRLAPNAAAVAVAAHTHEELMEKLDRFLDGEPGGLSGRQVYQQGEAQMRIFKALAAPTHRQVDALQEVASRCPL